MLLRMVGLFANDELEVNLKEVVVAYLKVIS